MAMQVYQHRMSDFFAVRWNHPIPALRTYFRELLFDEARHAAGHHGCARFRIIDATGHCLAEGNTGHPAGTSFPIQ